MWNSRQRIDVVTPLLKHLDAGIALHDSSVRLGHKRRFGAGLETLDNTVCRLPPPVLKRTLGALVRFVSCIGMRAPQWRRRLRLRQQHSTHGAETAPALARPSPAVGIAGRHTWRGIGPYPKMRVVTHPSSALIFRPLVGELSHEVFPISRPAARSAASPLPACGERSDREAVRVRDDAQGCALTGPSPASRLSEATKQSRASPPCGLLRLRLAMTASAAGWAKRREAARAHVDEPGRCAEVSGAEQTAVILRCEPDEGGRASKDAGTDGPSSFEGRFAATSG
jgi:hypothetical protein